MSKRALFVWGGWDGHTPKECVDLVAPRLEARGYETEISDTLDAYLDREALGAMDLVVQCWTGGRLTPEQESGLLAAVAAGTGFGGWHGGIIDAFHDNVNYQFLTGGQWVAHPGDIVPSHRVDIADPDHEITKGIGAFSIPDSEQYYLHVDPGVHVLCTTTFTGEYGDTGRYPAGTVMPYAWTRRWERGRVFVAAWGHTDRDFAVPEALTLVERGLLWASR